MHKNFVVTDKCGQLIPFGEICKVAQIPLRKNLNKPSIVVVDDDYCDVFIDTIDAQGWTHRVVPPIR